ncbi:MAG: flagellar hook-associated protein FlgK [Desulfovibrionaceae bacterium]|nr:flagellar hook-associated protein FlgK [Desulfovibrionaceae bacterium]
MLSNLLTIGKSALTTAQAWVNVTGDNVANADTAGYTRRYVVQKEAPTITVGGNQIGLGSNAEQVLRFFDKFLEDSYIAESTISSRWDQYDNIMESVESLFNESNTTGLSDTLNKFLESWQKLALNPEDPAVRTSVLTTGQTLDDLFQSMHTFIGDVQTEMDVSISEAVKRVNEISSAIGDINAQIRETEISHMIVPNSLYDNRDALVEELSTLVNVKTIDGGAGDYRVQLGTGQPLVDGTTTYSVDFMAPTAENRLTPESTFGGTIAFEGSDEFEYTMQIVNGGTIGGDTAPTFRVSLDGGKSWLKDESGSDLILNLTGSVTTDDDGNSAFVVDPVRVKDIFVSFTFDEADPSESARTLSTGDLFSVVPKSGLYWIEPTRGPENITPQMSVSGADNIDRVTGGKLTSYFSVRDDIAGRYRDELNALASSISWEVNHLHSQGAGLTKINQTVGQIEVPYTDQPLGTAQSGNVFWNRLETGAVNMYFYDPVTGENIAESQLLFNGANFDPETHSLEDIRDAFNALTLNLKDGVLTSLTDGARLFDAEIQNNRLIVKTSSEVQDLTFAFGQDSSGLLAALGLNSFFSGASASDLAISSDIGTDYTKVNAGRVNGGYEVNEGDNTVAAAIGDLLTKKVTISTFWKTVDQSLPNYYASLVSTVGSDKLHGETNRAYHNTLANSMLEQKESLTGVNLDEEMTNLVKYQSAYTAAAKLITTADEMLGVLIGLKQ